MTWDCFVSNFAFEATDSRLFEGHVFAWKFFQIFELGSRVPFSTSAKGSWTWALPTMLPPYYMYAAVYIPGWKGTRLRAFNWRKYAVFAWKSSRVTARYRPTPFISGSIDDKVNMELLWFCTRSNLRQVGCNVPNSCPLQTQCAVKMPSPFIFGPLVPARLCALVRAWAWPAKNYAVNRV